MVNARNKGRRGEREVIDEIKELLGIQLEVNYSQTFGGGHDLLGLDGFAIEVKRRKVITPGDLKNFWEQTTTQAKKTTFRSTTSTQQRQWKRFVPSECRPYTRRTRSSLERQAPTRATANTPTLPQ